MPSAKTPRIVRAAPLRVCDTTRRASLRFRRGPRLAEPVLFHCSCRAPNCRKVFWVCRPCYRGHAYCSVSCRAAARLEQRRRANHRYQLTTGGRRAHRERQRRYRDRRSGVGVTDQGGGNGRLHGELPAPWGDGAPSRVCVCAACGRVGRFVDPFYYLRGRPRGRRRSKKDVFR